MIASSIVNIRTGNSSAWKDLRIGLLGGSFDPAHEGHVYVSSVSKQFLQLDAVWWVPALSNPFKSVSQQQSFLERSKTCLRFIEKHNYLSLCYIERDLGLFRTFDTVKAIQKRFSQSEFVWLGGMDLAPRFHNWHKYDHLLSEIPVCFAARELGTKNDYRFKINNLSNRSVVNQFLSRPSMYPLSKRTLYWIKNIEPYPLSSSELRKRSA